MLDPVVACLGEGSTMPEVMDGWSMSGRSEVRFAGPTERSAVFSRRLANLDRTDLGCARCRFVYLARQWSP